MASILLLDLVGVKVQRTSVGHDAAAIADAVRHRRVRTRSTSARRFGHDPATGAWQAARSRDRSGAPADRRRARSPRTVNHPPAGYPNRVPSEASRGTISEFERKGGMLTYRRRGRVASLGLKGVDDLDARRLEVGAIASGNDQTVDEGRRCDQAILDRHGAARCTKTGQQLRPAQARLRLPRQTMDPLNPRVEPRLELGSSLPLWQKKDAEPNLTKNEGIDDDVALVFPKPLHDPGIWSRLRGLTQDIGVNKERHSVSVTRIQSGRRIPFRDRRATNRRHPHLAEPCAGRAGTRHDRGVRPRIPARLQCDPAVGARQAGRSDLWRTPSSSSDVRYRLTT